MRLLRFSMLGVLAAELAELGERELLLHFLLVALRIVRDAATHRALQLRHIVLDLAHSNVL